MRQYDFVLMVNLDEMNSGDFKLKLMSFPKIVAISLVPPGTQYNWVVVLER